MQIYLSCMVDIRQCIGIPISAACMQHKSNSTLMWLTQLEKEPVSWNGVNCTTGKGEPPKPQPNSHQELSRGIWSMNVRETTRMVQQSDMSTNSDWPRQHAAFSRGIEARLLARCIKQE